MKTEINNDVIFYGLIGKINNKILKINKKFVFVTVFVLFNLLCLAFGAGFLVLPFISFNSLPVKIVFSVIWAVCAFVTGDLSVSVQKSKNKLDLFGKIFGVAVIALCFGLVFVNTNYYRFGEWYAVFLTVILAVLLLTVVAALIIAFVKAPKAMSASFCYAMISVLVFIVFCYSAYLKKAGNPNIDVVVLISFFSLVSLALAFFIYVFFKKTKLRYLYAYSVFIFCAAVFLVGVSYLAHYLDENVSFVGTLVTLLASTLGGGLTLFGVAWTMKRNCFEREKSDAESKRRDFEEQRRTYFPHIKYVDANCENTYVVDKLHGLNFNDPSECEALIKKRFFAIYVEPFTVKNISEYPVCIRGIQVGNKKSKSKRYELLEPKEQIKISMIKRRIYDSEIRKHIYLLIEDRLGNNYKVKCDVAVAGGPVQSFQRGEYTGLLKTYIVKDIYRPVFVDRDRSDECENSPSEEEDKKA